MTKLQERTKVIPFRTYGYRVKVIVTNDVQRSGHKHGVCPDKAWFAFHAAIPDSNASVIILPTSTGVSTIAHESFHCVWAMMHHIGAEHENEIMAYTLGYLVREIAAFIWPQKVMKKKPARKRGSKKL